MSTLLRLNYLKQQLEDLKKKENNTIQDTKHIENIERIIKPIEMQIVSENTKDTLTPPIPQTITPPPPPPVPNITLKITPKSKQLAPLPPSLDGKVPLTTLSLDGKVPLTTLSLDGKVPLTTLSLDGKVPTKDTSDVMTKQIESKFKIMIENENIKFKTRENELLNELNTKNEEIKLLEGKIDKFKAGEYEFIRQFEIYKANEISLLQEISKHTKNTSNTLSSNDSVVKGSSDIISELSNLRLEYDHYKTNMIQHIEKLKENETNASLEYKKNIDDLKNELYKSQSLSTELQSQLDKANDQFAQLQYNIQILTNEKLQFSNDINQLNKEITRLNNLIFELNSNKITNNQVESDSSVPTTSLDGSVPLKINRGISSRK
jgi:uncharacterized coiled-coil DUF342 family protein